MPNSLCYWSFYYGDWYANILFRSFDRKCINFTVLAIIFIWGATVGIYYEQDVICKRFQNKVFDNLKNGTIEYIFDSDGVITISEPEYVTSKYKWDEFQGWGIFKNYIYLQTITQKYALMKKNNLTPEDYESLISLLNTHVQQKEICH